VSKTLLLDKTRVPDLPTLIKSLRDNREKSIMYINTTCFQHIPKLVPADQNATAG
jgi:predicted AAA+ superfamily ATPase